MRKCEEWVADHPGQGILKAKPSIFGLGRVKEVVDKPNFKPKALAFGSRIGSRTGFKRKHSPHHRLKSRLQIFSTWGESPALPVAMGRATEAHTASKKAARKTAKVPEDKRAGWRMK